MHEHLFLVFVQCSIGFLLFSPPEIADPRTNGTHSNPSQDFHRLPCHSSTNNDPNVKYPSTQSEDLNGSFEDEDDDEHSHPVDQIDASYPRPFVLIKAYALYDFNGKQRQGFARCSFIFIFFRSKCQWWSIRQCRSDLCRRMCRNLRRGSRRWMDTNTENRRK